MERWQNAPLFMAMLRGVPMGFDWIVLGLVAWALGLLFVLILLRMAGDQDRAARHAQRSIDPHSDVTITRSGNW